MAGQAQAPVTRARWYEATFEVGEKSVRVQYLSDHELNNKQIADLVSRGYDYGRVWVNDRAQGTASSISRAAEMIRNAGEPMETKVAARASEADARNLERLRTLQAAAPVAERVAEAFVETGRRTASALGVVPVRTEEDKSLREQESERRGRTTVVAEAARGERGRIESTLLPVELPSSAEAERPPAESQPEEKRGQRTYVTLPYFVMRGSQGVGYEFEVVYDSSRPGVGVPAENRGYVDASFFDKPENRGGIVRYRYRRVGVGAEWGAWQAPGRNGQEFHRDYIKLTRSPMKYEVRDAEGVVARFNLYLDQDAARRLYGTASEAETRDMVAKGLANATDPIKFLRELQESGIIAGFSTQSKGEGEEVIWVRGNINNFLSALERTYGRDASRLGFTQA